MPGIILAAPSSAAGKTTITLGLLHALSRRGVALKPAKSGPDYIDPQFHTAACGAPCVNLDAWAMPPDRLQQLAATDDLLIIEGAMGLFDGAPPDGKGASADLARVLSLPVVLILDAAKTGHSIAAMAAGFANHDPSVRIAGVILNNVGSDKHKRILHSALAPTGLPILGTLPRSPALARPSRHLGLVQPQEQADFDSFLSQAADLIECHIDLDQIITQAQPIRNATTTPTRSPPAQSIAIASDAAFAFCYTHMLNDWRAAGAEITFFSPLNDDAVPKTDLIYLPGGYPELHAGRLAANMTFLNSLNNVAQTSDIYGECGGYMTLGQTLTDAEGTHHQMAGLLDLHSSFATRKLHLGYRDLVSTTGPLEGTWKGHEFHYASTLYAHGTPLFAAKDAEGAQLPPMGLTSGRVSGSFAHIIDRA